MTRALLVEAHIPRHYWFWALREAVIRMNLLPCRPTKPAGTDTDPELGEFQEFPDLHVPPTARRGSDLRFDACSPTPSTLRCPESTNKLTTPFELFYGTKPDYRTLFQWGCLGYFRRTRDSTSGRGQFDMHSSVGIAIGRINHTNGMVFWDPVTQRMNVSADYKLDPEAAIGTPFPPSFTTGRSVLWFFAGGRILPKNHSHQALMC